jgi:hypothetical protein
MNTFPVRCGFRRTMTSIAIHRLFLLIVTVTAFTVSALAQDIQKLDPALEQLVGPEFRTQPRALHCVLCSRKLAAACYE